MLCSTAARFLPSKFRLLTIEGENEPLLGEFNKKFNLKMNIPC